MHHVMSRNSKDLKITIAKVGSDIIANMTSEQDRKDKYPNILDKRKMYSIVAFKHAISAKKICQ